MASATQIAVIDRDVATTIEKVMVRGDLSSLSATERVNYYNQVCQSLGLNPLTRPLEFVRLQGKETLYARKDATDQLRRIHGVSIEITKRERIEDVYVVQAKATSKDGRYDEATGAVTIGGAKGDALANALMKAETKAKRRVTLSICGMGILDESELETTSARLPPVRAHVADVAPVDADKTAEALASIAKAGDEAALAGMAASVTPDKYTTGELSVLRSAFTERRAALREAAKPAPKKAGSAKAKVVDAPPAVKVVDADYGPPPLTDDERAEMEALDK